MRSGLAAVTLGWALCGLVAGCGGQAKSRERDLSAPRAQYVLAEEPANALGIVEFREGKSQAEQVVLVGRIGGHHETWSPGAAAFVMTDPAMAIAMEGHSHPHDDGCAFCKKRQENLMNSIAIVQFQDAEGRVLPIDARELFELEEKQTVVVTGRAAVDSLGHLVVAARGIYVRR